MEKDLERYSCQMTLPNFGEEAQALLSNARVLIVGAGGLGCPAAQYLAACGVGTISIADDDVISVSNLHRQILYDPDDTGKNKALMACERLQRQNPDIRIVPYPDRVTTRNVTDIFNDHDVIVDCTDNFETRYLLNDAAVLAGKPLVYGAIYQYEGQVAVWNVTNADGDRSANYRDLYPSVNASQVPNCSVGGVIPTLAGIIGCMQANEVIKYITKQGELLSSKVLLFDALHMQSRIIRLNATSKVHISTLPQEADVALISAGELRELIATNEVDLIDVRTYQERDLDDIGGEHIPLDELIDNLHRIDPNRWTVFYCATGKRSDEAVRSLRNKLSSEKMLSLEGGMSGWYKTEEE